MGTGNVIGVGYRGIRSMAVAGTRQCIQCGIQSWLTATAGGPVLVHGTGYTTSVVRDYVLDTEYIEREIGPHVWAGDDG